MSLPRHRLIHLSRLRKCHIIDGATVVCLELSLAPMPRPQSGGIGGQPLTFTKSRDKCRAKAVSGTANQPTVFRAARGRCGGRLGRVPSIAELTSNTYDLVLIAVSSREQKRPVEVFANARVRPLGSSWNIFIMSLRRRSSLTIHLELLQSLSISPSLF